MGIGVIIIFRNNEKEISEIKFVESLDQITNLKLCFVNNGSSDDTFDLLKSIQIKSTSDIAILDVKKKKKPEAAIRIGARYFYNIQEFKHIGYINACEFSDFDKLHQVLITTYASTDLLIDIHTNTRRVRQNLFKNLFSVVDFLKRIHTDPLD
ncbi:MAG: hypothetical protein GKR88_07055 [Flavobacteriaceae bacterium]|nr:MAG: hypothetical protein GKR88_07055 [Flavobacteriaceae bacterium]